MSDDFMGSLQLTKDDFGKFKVITLINDHYFKLIAHHTVREGL